MWNVPTFFATLNSTRSAAMRPSGLVKTTLPLATMRSSGSVYMSMTSAKNPIWGHSTCTWPVIRTWLASILSKCHCVLRVQEPKNGSFVASAPPGGAVWASAGTANAHRVKQRQIRQKPMTLKELPQDSTASETVANLSYQEDRARHAHTASQGKRLLDGGRRIGLDSDTGHSMGADARSELVRGNRARGVGCRCNDRRDDRQQRIDDTRDALVAHYSDDERRPFGVPALEIGSERSRALAVVGRIE